jgi:serine/threonine-protein kinase HipA
MTASLNVFVGGRRVAVLSSPDGFTHHLTYDRDVGAEDFASLLMPVQPQSWEWPSLHPFFQVNLPEGFLLSVLKEQLGPHLGARPLDLLAVVGQNMIGRVQVSAGESLTAAGARLNVEPLLHSEASTEIFMDLLRQYAASGVSGVVPKFLTPETQGLFHKGALATERHIVKSSSAALPFMALNEHLCMEVARRTRFATPQTTVSADGQVLVVERFDIDPQSGRRLGFEDCCSLLGLTSDDKYQSTWERVARLAKEFVPAHNRRSSLEHLAVTLLLTYALGNADCHTKNLALVYSDVNDVRAAPIYDMLTIRAYEKYADNPPGMFIDGRKSWSPGKALWRALQQHFEIDPPRQRELAQLVCDATSSVLPELIRRTRETPGFSEIGGRMIWEWNEGMNRLRGQIRLPRPSFVDQACSAGVAQPPPLPKHADRRIGESELLGHRGPPARPPS